MHSAVKKYLLLFVNSENDLAVFSQQEIEYVESVLLHKEERTRTIRDQWGNWDFPYTDFDYTRPYLDEYVLEILSKNRIEQKRLWPGGKKFAICISHDVDFVTEDSKDIFFRAMFKRKIPKTDLLKLPYSYAREQLRGLMKKNDRLWVYEKWLEEMNKHNFTSTFFYFSRPETKDLHVYDCDYLFSDKVQFTGKQMTVAEMMRQMDANGFEIGLHGSYHTYSRPELLLKQKQHIESVIQKPVTSTRQHWLHFDIYTTPEVQYASGLKVDSTLGFNRTIGFRAGTAFPYMLTDKNLDELPLMEVPMHIMDGPLFLSNSLELNEEYAIKRALKMMDKVEWVGGCLTINFHPNYIIYPQWWNTFKAILNEAKQRDAYCVKMRDFESILKYRS
jgi:peptidoglycan/xylan/chitin deacetylase (PgdA/CDA1 family)